jgi:hypothetical protein
MGSARHNDATPRLLLKSVTHVSLTVTKTAIIEAARMPFNGADALR